MSDLRCPLWVVRKQYDEEKDSYVRPCVELCDEPVWLVTEEARYLDADGVTDATGPTWKVACQGGHVLLLPDHEGDDNFTLIPFDPAYLAEAGVSPHDQVTDGH